MRHWDSNIYNHIGPVVYRLMESGAHSATKVLSEFLVVRATRQATPAEAKRGEYGKRARFSREEIHVTLGEPNYNARKFIALCKAAKEPFPVKKIWLELLPIKRKKDVRPYHPKVKQKLY